MNRRESGSSNGRIPPEWLKKGLIIGKGAFGAVYRLNKQEWCVKVQPSNFKAVLDRECSILSQLSKVRGVPRFISKTAEPDGACGMVMTLLGPSVEQMTREACAGSHLSLPTVLKIGIQIVDILAHIHEQGITHNDIKPSNMVMGNPLYEETMHHVHLIDFGIATTMNYESSSSKQHDGKMDKMELDGKLEKLENRWTKMSSPERENAVRAKLATVTTQQLASHVLACDEAVSSNLTLREAGIYGIQRICACCSLPPPRVELRGTPRFCSLRQHFGLPTRPSDDYESLAYTLLQLAGVALPWSVEKNPQLSPEEQRAQRNASYYRIGVRKSALFYKMPDAVHSIPSDLLKRLNMKQVETRKTVAKRFPILIQFFDKVTSSCEPDPNVLRKILVTGLEQLQMPFDYQYDWSAQQTGEYNYSPPGEDDFAQCVSARNGQKFS